METRINASAIKPAIAGRFGVVPSINDGNAPWKEVEKDSEGNPLEAGALYCKCTMYEDECDAIRFGCLARHTGPQRFVNGDPWPLAAWEEHEPLPTVGEVVQYVAGAILLGVFCFGVLGLS